MQPSNVLCSAALCVGLAACQAAAQLEPTRSPAPEPAQVVAPASATPTSRAPATQALPTPEASPVSGPTPALAEPMEISSALDLPYTSERTLDVFAPVIANEWPLVVILHGGNVSSKSVRGLAQAVAGQGAVVFVPNYHSSQPTSAEVITLGAEDAACAVRFARTQAAQYGGTPERVIAVGHSAGGAFAVVTALAGDDFEGDCLVADGSALADGVVGLDGAYDILRYTQTEFLKLGTPEQWQRISPFTYVYRKPLRPGLEFVFFAGAETELVQNAQALRDALQAAGYSASATQIPGVDHMSMGGSYLPQTIAAITDLMRR